MAVLDKILAIPELDPTYSQMGISGKSPAKMKDMMGKKSNMKGDKKMMSEDDDDDEDDDDRDDEGMKMKRMRDRLKKLKGKIPTGSMTVSDVKPKAMKSNY